LRRLRRSGSLRRHKPRRHSLLRKLSFSRSLSASAYGRCANSAVRHVLPHERLPGQGRPKAGKDNQFLANPYWLGK
jgi:hypothetical protein